MASNGQTQQALRQCSCSIDVIASNLPYDKYEQAETVFRMRRGGGGYLGEMFRAGVANDMVRDLEEAQGVWSKMATGQGAAVHIFIAMDSLLYPQKPSAVPTANV